ncbi:MULTISPECIES: hypothetical protein [unclassified Halomonas]|uniref:hypothetical protein n=1 Tax=unclassified Halomonas TaxID=2609666 RepID=UPI0005566012|nr:MULTISPECIES: hypothetical protein [unclassified Halomonas]CEP33903.1 Putative uncharacterized protein [Halomonas sp. R57-5]
MVIIRGMAFIANFALLGFVLIELVDRGFGRSIENQVFMALLLLLPVLSIAALASSKVRSKEDKAKYKRDNIFTLYMQRKALEEKAKIKKFKESE